MGGERARVLLVDFDDVVIAGLTAILKEHDYEVVGQSRDPNQAPVMAVDLLVDVVFLGGDEQGPDPAQTALALKASRPEAKIVVLADSDSPEGVMEAAAAGVDAYLLVKDLTPTVLIDSLRQIRQLRLAVYSGPLLQSAARSSWRRSGDDEQIALLAKDFLLSHREAQVLARIREGESNEEISVRLGIRPETAKKYVRRVLVKLGARSRTQAAVMAARSGRRRVAPSR